MSDKLQDGIKSQAEKFSAADFINRENFAEELDALIIEAFNIGKNRPEIFESNIPISDRLHKSNHRTSSRYHAIIKSNRAADYILNTAKDYDSRYIKVKFKESLMAFGFRVVTTLTIGFSIMLVYWVAHCLKIPMPLLKLPL
ncbi:MAG: hypothetical protein ACK4S8_15610 [Alishewanella aestuarii]